MDLPWAPSETLGGKNMIIRQISRIYTYTCYLHEVHGAMNADKPILR